MRVHHHQTSQNEQSSRAAPSPRTRGEGRVRGRGRALRAKAVKLARRGEVNASTISKVQFFRHAIELALSGKLHTAGH